MTTPHPATIGTDQGPEPDWTNQDWRDPIRHALAAQILYELSDIEDAMAAAGHHGPLRDTIPRLIFDAAKLTEVRRHNRDIDRQLANVKLERDAAVNRSKAATITAQTFEERSRWLFERAMIFCATELKVHDDD